MSDERSGRSELSACVGREALPDASEDLLCVSVGGTETSGSDSVDDIKIASPRVFADAARKTSSDVVVAATKCVPSKGTSCVFGDGGRFSLSDDDATPCVLFPPSVSFSSFAAALYSASATATNAAPRACDVRTRAVETTRGV
jgi:hypothetical protein